MKKKILLVAIALGLMTTSCVKDGDFEELGGKMSVTLGESVSLAFPLGSAEFTIGELLNKWQNTNSTPITWQDDGQGNTTLAIRYTDSISYDIPFATNKKKKNVTTAKPTKTVEPLDTIFSYPMNGSVAIDLFDNMDAVINNISLQGINALLSINLRAIMGTTGSNDNAVFLQQFIDAPYIDNLTISSTGRDGSTTNLPLTSPSGSTTFTLDELVSPEGCTLNLNNANGAIDDLVNSRPKQMSYSLMVKVHIHITAQQIQDVENSGQQFPSDINDVLGNVVKINELKTRASITADFPLRMKVSNLTYADTSMSDGTININEIKDALSKIDEVTGGSSFRIGIKYTNSIPMSFTVSDVLFDQNMQPAQVKVNGEVQTVHFFAQNFVIPAPQLTTGSGSGLRYSTGEVSSTMLLDITKEQIEAMKNFGGMGISFKLNTADQNNGAHVSVRDNDKLKLQAFLLINPDEKTLNEFRSK